MKVSKPEVGTTPARTLQHILRSTSTTLWHYHGHLIVPLSKSMECAMSQPFCSWMITIPFCPIHFVHSENTGLATTPLIHWYDITENFWVSARNLLVQVSGPWKWKNLWVCSLRFERSVNVLVGDKGMSHIRLLLTSMLSFNIRSFGGRHIYIRIPVNLPALVGHTLAHNFLKLQWVSYSFCASHW